MRAGVLAAILDREAKGHLPEMSKQSTGGNLAPYVFYGAQLPFQPRGRLLVHSDVV